MAPFGAQYNMMTITVTQEEAQVILLGLGELPAKMSIDLIIKLKNEFESQMNNEDKGSS
jgi:hypothetical protein